MSYRKVIKTRLLCPTSILGTSQTVETGGRQPNLHLLALKAITMSAWLAEAFVKSTENFDVLLGDTTQSLQPLSPLLADKKGSFETSIPVPAAQLKPHSRRRCEDGWMLSHANWVQEDYLSQAIPDQR